MAKAPTPKIPANVTITRPWQIAFVVSLAVSQVAYTCLLGWSFITSLHWTHLASRSFEIMMLVYPLLLFAVSYIFAHRRIRGNWPRLFWASFLAVLGYVAYNTVELGMNLLYAHVIGYRPSNAWWTGAPGQVVQMISFVVLFAIALFVVTKRGKRT